MKLKSKRIYEELRCIPCEFEVVLLRIAPASPDRFEKFCAHAVDVLIQD